MTPQMYLLIHNSAADLSILSDFETIKDKLDLVNKCFVTLTDPLVIEDLPIKIRDTQLLAPGVSRSLSALSSLYSGIDKLKVSHSDITDMESFWNRDPESFRLYALQDALITLVHGCRMAQFNLELGGLGVPVTLSGLSGRYLKESWRKMQYSGYQPNTSYLLSDSAKLQTPRGLFTMDQLGLKLSLFIGNFKGGRNETFMYGVDKDTIWYDYDVVSAYTTVMAMMGDPQYDRMRVLTTSELNELSDNDLLYSYTIIHCEFEFDEKVKYPSIGCFIDQTTTVYPLKGTGLLTGSEYLLAKSQGCMFKIIEVVYIPFKTDVKPFLSSIKEIQRLRSEHPKGSFLNALYKELGNTQYGLTARGISYGKRFDLKLGKSVRLDPNEFGNPIICSWITAFIRSLVGELMHYVSQVGGQIVSVTTDGFITNYSSLLSYEPDNSTFSLYAEFCKSRKELSGNSIGLEEKRKGPGITT